jgi:hypothetical protein
MKMNRLLKAISSTEPSTFNEFCNALETDMPSEKSQWRELFIALEELEKQGLVEVDRTNGKIDTLMLTEAGADRIRAEMDAERPLFNKS